MHDQKILVKQLDAGLPLPRHAAPGDAGVDLLAREGGVVDPGERALVPTGVAVALPPGFVGLITPRSGLAINHGISLVNSPGVLDSGFRGEICAIVINEGTEPFKYARGDRIAQLVVVPFVRQNYEVVDELPTTERGSGGFGSTGR